MTSRSPLGARDRFLKRTVDILLSFIGLLLLGWLILILWFVATIDMGRNGFFTQVRVGLHGKRFRILKIRTMRDRSEHQTTVTRAGDPRITRVGALIRRFKLDELPQLVNVLLGHMSFVGPRPDVPGFADRLMGPDRVVLSVRPGITGPASLAFRGEEEILDQQADPEEYNQDVLYPRKIRINRHYIENFRLQDDFKYMWHTIIGTSCR